MSPGTVKTALEVVRSDYDCVRWLRRAVASCTLTAGCCVAPPGVRLSHCSPRTCVALHINARAAHITSIAGPWHCAGHSTRLTRHASLCLGSVSLILALRVAFGRSRSLCNTAQRPRRQRRACGAMLQQYALSLLALGVHPAAVIIFEILRSLVKCHGNLAITASLDAVGTPLTTITMQLIGISPVRSEEATLTQP